MILRGKHLIDAAKSGVAQETLENAARRVSTVMTEQEARQILGVTEDSALEEIVKASSVLILCTFVTLSKYENLFETNAKNGSFYIQSKVHRAKECLEGVYQRKGEGPPSQESG
ncbi:hypothetical protein Dsin_018810 [Dipteronia sinensis]|uniref:Uncharacterized protein n=1 Tax=Dipteronia sinensis TaxID=43782 RepID=A0AAE0E3F6_9ROSI|nr:hypothetical protein Dsin_018810 [Dipteronia sinensis]